MHGSKKLEMWRSKNISVSEVMKVQCQDMQTHWQQEQTKIQSGTHTKSWDRQEDARIRPVHQNFEKWICLMKFCVQRGSTLFNIILLT